MNANEQTYRMKRLETELQKAQKHGKSMEDKVWNLEDEFAKTNRWVEDLEKRIKRLENPN